MPETVIVTGKRYRQADRLRFVHPAPTDNLSASRPARDRSRVATLVTVIEHATGQTRELIGSCDPSFAIEQIRAFRPSKFTVTTEGIETNYVAKVKIAIKPMVKVAMLGSR